MSEPECVDPNCEFCGHNRLNQRPESYSTKGPAVVGNKPDYSRCTCAGTGQAMRCVYCLAQEEKPKLSVEQVAHKLRKFEFDEGLSDLTHDQALKLSELIAQLPQLDVVDECIKSFKLGCEAVRCSRFDIQRVLRRYLELRGLPADPELEGK